MEYGIPCIGTDEGGIRNIIDEGNTGYIVPKNDAQSLAERIEKLLSDAPLREKMGKAGKERFLRLFTEERFEMCMRDCLKSCLG